MLEMGPQDPVPSDSSKYPLSQSEPCASQRDDSHLFQIPRLPAPKVICSLLLNSDLPLPMPAFPPGKHPPYSHSLQNLLETMA